MKKIPTLFVRNPEDRAHVLDQVTPGCEWVFAGEGTATRKYDGTCVLYSLARNWYTRREVKPGKAIPVRWVQVEYDTTTGKAVGWEPFDQSPFAKYLTEAIGLLEPHPQPGTFELVGPKVNGNPEGYVRHTLLRHATAERYPAMNAPAGYDELRRSLTALPWEGIVWHHPDGRMAKLKARDFR